MKNGTLKKSLSVFLAILMIVPTLFATGAPGLLSLFDGIAPQAEATTVDVAKLKNEAAIRQIQGLNTDVTVLSFSGNHQVFAEDEDYVETAHYDALYHNMLYFDGVVDYNASATSAKTEYGSSWTGSNGITIYWYHPTATLLYEGDTTNYPRLAVAMNTVMYYTGTWSRKTVNRLGYIASGGNGFNFTQNWHGSDGRLNVNYMWHGQNEMMGYTSTVVNDGMRQTLSGNSDSHFYVNTLKYTASMNDSTYWISAQPTFAFYGDNGDDGKTITATTSDTLYVINYVPLKNALNRAIEIYNAVNTNPGNYTPESVAKFVELANALVAAKPNNFVNANQNNPAGYAAAAEAAVTAWNNWRGLEERTVELVYENLFVFNSWAYSDSSKPNSTLKGTVTTNIQNGTIVFENIAGNGQTNPHDFYSDNGYSNSHYCVELNNTENKEYVLTYTTSGGNGDQVFVFFRDENGNAVSVNGSEHKGAYGNGNSTNSLTFSVSPDVKRITFRFGSTKEGETVTFSNITLFEKSRLEELGMVSWTNADGTPFVFRTPYTYGDTLQTPPTPYRTGYTFGGWAVDNNGDGMMDEGDSGTFVDGFVGSFLMDANYRLFSIWSVNNYTIFFDGNGQDGGSVAELPMTYDVAQNLPANGYTKAGYTFKGWNTAKDGSGTAYSDGASVMNLCTGAAGDTEITLYAQWDVNYHTVKFVNDAGLEVSSATYAYGTPAANITLPANTAPTAYESRENHYVYKWQTVQNVTGDAIYYEEKTTEAHTVTTTVTPPTCTTQGFTTYYCDVCKGSYDADYVDASGHNYTEEIITDPTCTSGGEKKLTCTGCGDVKTETINPTGHTLVAVDQIPATCTENGVAAHYKCDCGALFTDSAGTSPTTADALVIEAGGHNYIEVAHNDATCDLAASATYTCSKCSDTYNQTTGEALGHEYVSVKNDPEATCTTPGTAHFDCSRCDATKTEPIAALGHKGTYVEGYDSTCTEYGVLTHWYCAQCESYFADEDCTQELDSVSIAIKAHEWSDWTETLAPTCSAEGTERRDCANCDAFEEQVMAIVADAHNWGAYVAHNDGTHTRTCSYNSNHIETGNCSYGDWVDTKHADCLNAGEQTKTCTLCSGTTTQAIPANGHIFGETVAMKDATCTEDGHFEYKICTVCNKYFANNAYGNATDGKDDITKFVIEAHGHFWKNATCTAPKTCENCGETEGEALGHTPAAAVEENRNEATCTVAGSYESVVYCSVCNAEISRKTETIAAAGHQFGAVTPAKAATCVATGNEAYKSCTVCNKFFAADAATASTAANDSADAFTTQIDPDNHDLKTTAAKAPTCTEIGWDEYVTCQREGCGYTTYAEKAATDHNYGDWTFVADGTHKRVCKNDENHVETEACADSATDTDCNCDKCSNLVEHSYGDATCDAPATCTVCGATTGDKLGHDFKNYVSDNNATCLANGTETATCKRCDATDTREDDNSALGHKNKVHHEKVDATCVAEGTIEYWSCPDCGKNFSDEACANEVTDLTIAIDGSNHVNTTDHTQTDATCLTVGYTAGTFCEDCDKWISGHEEIPAIAHKNKVHHERVESTCSEEGTIEYWSCPDCDKNFSDEACTTEATDLAVAINSEAHKWDEGKVTTEPGCITEGVKTYTCQYNSEHTYTESVSATNHKFDVHTPANEATCVKGGNKAYKLCSNCKLYFAEDAAFDSNAGQTSAEAFATEINPDNHDLKTTEAKAPTCTEIGWDAYVTCQREGCGYTTYKAIEAKGHDYDLTTGTNNNNGTHTVTCKNCGENTEGHTDVVDCTYGAGVVTAPTCTKGGYTTHTCTVCSYSYTDAATDANGHQFGDWKAIGNDKHERTCTVCTDEEGRVETADCTYDEWTETKAPTCTEKGKKAHTCSVCNNTVTEEVKELGHAYGDADCLKPATCTRCGETTGKALGHDFTVYVETVGYTCTEQGYDIYKCSRCDETEHQNYTDAAHKFGPVTQANNATCLADGNEAYKQCTVCNLYFAENAATDSKDGKADTSTFVIAQLAHSYTGAIKSDGNGKDATHSFKCVNGCNEYGAAVKHTWNDGVENPEADCENAGTMTFTCTADSCGATYTETVNPDGHSFGNWVDEVPATCIKEGTKGYYECTVCHKYFEADKTTVISDLKLEKDTANHTKLVKTDAVAATCTADGNIDYWTCEGCAKIYSDAEAKTEITAEDTIVKATGHSYTSKVTAPTCTEQGYTTYTCSCGDTYKDNYVAATGHTYGNWTPAADKQHSKTCSKCGDVVTETCTESAWIIDKPTTCQEAGSQYKHCTVCNGELERETIAKLDHRFDAAPVYDAETGKHVYTCTYVLSTNPTAYCTATKTEDCADSPDDTDCLCDLCGHLVAHNYGAATCDEPATCTVCGETTGDKLGHDWDAPTYTWAENGSTCSATRVCKRDSEHVATATSTVSSEITTPATCIKKGKTTYTATFSVDWATTQTLSVEDVAIDATNHVGETYTKDEDIVAGTCTKEKTWNEATYCTDCNAKLGTEAKTGEKDLNNHVGETYTKDEDIVAGTCTEEKTWNEVTYCADCNAKLGTEAKTGEKDINNHVGETYTKDEDIVAGTCTKEKTWNEVTYCTDCNAKLGTEAKTGEKDLNNHVGETYTKDEDIVAGTCTEEKTWKEVTYCSDCDTKLSTVAKIGEKDVNNHDLKTTAAKAPTCTEIGWDAYVTCSRCDYTTYVEKAKLGHDEISHEAKASTCTEIGWDAYVTCSRCDYTTYAEKAALGHDEISHEAKAPTCTEIAWDAYVTCSRCDYTTYVEKTALGHDEIAHEAKASTCTEIGWDAYVTCSRCDYTTYAEKVALGHDEIAHEAKAPTCTEIGWDAYVTCSRCDYTTYAEKAALGHDEIAHEAKAPTCTEIGWDAYVTCSRCDYTTYAEKAALGHDEIAHEAKAPTCTEIGWDAYVTCSRCDYTTYVEKTALGHDEIAHEAKAPTCTEIGWDAYVTCSRCDYTMYVEKAKLGHDEIAHEEKAPTCTEIGWDAYVTCSRCDYTTYVEKAKLGHDEIAHEAKAPTCTEIGWDAYVTCSRCDYTTYAEKAALGHTVVVDKAVAPTCTKTGLTEGSHCDVCGEVLVAQEVVEALGHTWGAWKVTTAATCTENGEERRDCSACDAFETNVLTAAGHKYDAVVTDPTCTAEGFTTYTCSVCDDSYVADKVTALGHTEGEVVVENNVAPDCVNEGSYDNVVYCTVCDAELSRETVKVAALGHTAGEAANENVVDATCEADGSYDVVVRCTVCSKVLESEHIVVDKLGHDYRLAELRRPTQKADGTWGNGYETYVCKNDSKHNYSNVVYRADYAAYDEIVAKLNERLADSKLDAGVAAEIEDMLADNAVLPDRIASEQADVDNAAAALTAAGAIYQTTYTVTFVADDQIVSEQTVFYGSAAEAPEAPEKEGFLFTGWEGKYSNVQADVTITATYFEGSVVVDIAADSVKLTVGETKQIVYTVLPADADVELTWTSANTAVATVDEEGVVTGLKNGATTITVTALNGTISETVIVYVYKANAEYTVQLAKSPYGNYVINDYVFYETAYINVKAGQEFKFQFALNSKYSPEDVIVTVNGLELSLGEDNYFTVDCMTENLTIIVIPAPGSGLENGDSDNDNTGSNNTAHSCWCHSSNKLLQFLWKILMFLCKIFGIEKYHYCGCGKAHW